jgi:hypothetical protein
MPSMPRRALVLVRREPPKPEDVAPDEPVTPVTGTPIEGRVIDPEPGTTPEGAEGTGPAPGEKAEGHGAPW